MYVCVYIYNTSLLRFDVSFPECTSDLKVPIVPNRP